MTKVTGALCDCAKASKNKDKDRAQENKEKSNRTERETKLNSTLDYFKQVAGFVIRNIIKRKRRLYFYQAKL